MGSCSPEVMPYGVNGLQDKNITFRTLKNRDHGRDLPLYKSYSSAVSLRTLARGGSVFVATASWWSLSYRYRGEDAK